MINFKEISTLFDGCWLEYIMEDTKNRASKIQIIDNDYVSVG